MSWRRHETHAAETQAVKAALSAADIVAAVGHGSGTAWGWLEVYIGGDGRPWHEADRDGPTWGPCPLECGECARIRAITAEVYRIVRETTGRTGDYNGNTLLLHQDKGACRIFQSGAWSPEAWASGRVLARKAAVPPPLPGPARVQR